MLKINMEGWIKLHRKFIEWEWYDDSYMVHLFIHLLMKANHKPRKWRGVQVDTGQLITGYNSLAEDLGMSVKMIRTRIDKLEKTGEIGRLKGNQFSVITINNYESYQVHGDDEGRPEGSQRAGKGQAKGSKQELKKDNNEKNILNRKSNFKKSLDPYVDKYPREMLNEFFLYWIEPNKSQKKMRWEMEPTWSVGGRLARWHKNYQEKHPTSKGSNLGGGPLPEGYGDPSPTAITREEYIKSKEKNHEEDRPD